MNRARRTIEPTVPAEYAATLVRTAGPEHPAHEQLRAEMRRFVATAERQAVVRIDVTQEIRASNGDVRCWLVTIELECGHRTTGLATPRRGADTTRPCVACYVARQNRLAVAERLQQADLFGGAG